METSHRPQDMVFTLFGDFLLHRPGPVWVGSLIELLEPLGVSQGGARTVLSRMARKGWLETVREGRRSYYDLTAAGRRLLEEGESRIYHPPSGQAWDGAWTLLSYSIPEEQRALRDRLRTRLSWLGYGSLGNGLWISPHDTREQVREAAAALDVEEHIEVFRGAHVGFSDDPTLAARCWDLPAINRGYDAFITRHLDAFLALRRAGGGGIGDREAFVRRIGLVHEYREFPLLDPFLPRPLQPEGWAGECALALFDAYHELLGPPADRHLESIVQAPSSAATPAP